MLWHGNWGTYDDVCSPPIALLPSQLRDMVDVNRRTRIIHEVLSNHHGTLKCMLMLVVMSRTY